MTTSIVPTSQEDKKTWKHLNRRDPPIQKRFDVTGQRFGKLAVIRFFGKDRRKALLFECYCDCGNKCVTMGKALRSGKDSCGCLTGSKIGDKTRTHGQKNTPEYRVWAAMKARCFNKNNLSYYRYGGRGITVCERWLLFTNFIADMGPRQVGTSLDRINNDGNYEPNNCQWRNSKQQARNRSSSLNVDIAAIAKKRGIGYKHAWSLYRAGRLA